MTDVTSLTWIHVKVVEWILSLNSDDRCNITNVDSRESGRVDTVVEF